MAAFVWVAVGLLTWLMLVSLDGRSPGAPEPWYGFFLLDGIPGLILTGGVHSGAPIWVLGLGVCVSNATCWALAVYVVARLLAAQRLRRRTSEL